LNESRLGNDIVQPAPSIRSISPVSNTSSTTRQLFEAAAPRATEKSATLQVLSKTRKLTFHSLWRTPFGADVLVRTGNILIKVHRNIVVPQSGWFRDNLPPPNLVSVHPFRHFMNELTAPGWDTGHGGPTICP
jgi:hypothetical protein